MSKPPYIIEVNKLWSGYKGFTFYPFIFVTEPDNERLIRHEKVHIRQQLDGWLIGFYLKYLYYQWKYGYEKNPYEIEAYRLQDDKTVKTIDEIKHITKV